MNAVQFPLIIRAHLRLVIACALGGLLLGLLVGMMKGRVSTATAQVVVSVRGSEAGSPADQAATIQPQLSTDYLSTQIDIIKSDRVAQRAVQTLKLDQDPEALKRFRESGAQGSAVEYFGRILQRQLKVKPSLNSRVVSIEYASPDPALAAAVANAVAKAYQDVSLDLQIDPARQADGWYQRNLEEVRNRLADAQAKLSARQRELGVTAPIGSGGATQVDPEEARLTGLSQNLAMAQAAQTAASSRAGGGALPDAMLNPVVQALDTDLKRLEAQRSQLATHVGPNGSAMIEINNQIASLRRQRNAQASMVASSAATAAGQAQANVAQLAAQVAAEKERVIRSNQARAQLSSLQQDVDGLRRTYDDLVSRQAQALLASSGQQTNVTLLSPAVPTPAAGAVLAIALALVGAFIGVIFGMIMAIVREFMDQRVRSADDAEVWLGIPNLGAVHLLPQPQPRALPYAPRKLLSFGRE